MKVVGIMGSPRKDGNTAYLLRKVMEGVMDCGAEALTFNPNEIASWKNGATD